MTVTGFENNNNNLQKVIHKHLVGKITFINNLTIKLRKDFDVNNESHVDRLKKEISALLIKGGSSFNKLPPLIMKDCFISLESNVVKLSLKNRKCFGVELVAAKFLTKTINKLNNLKEKIETKYNLNSYKL